MRISPNQVTAPNAGGQRPYAVRASWTARVGGFLRWPLHTPMPNGDPDFHTKTLPGLERFFARLAPAITRFAERHSLRIQRYYHDLPSWQLCFDHPKGGCAYVEVRRERDDSFRLLSVWWVDGAGIRSSRFADAGAFRVRGTDIESLLQKHYTTVLRWQPGHWTLVSQLP